MEGEEAGMMLLVGDRLKELGMAQMMEVQKVLVGREAGVAAEV